MRAIISQKKLIFFYEKCLKIQFSFVTVAVTTLKEIAGMGQG